MTDRTHYRVFNERSGNPPLDNAARRANRALSRSVRGSFRVHAGRSGWQRKHRLTKETMVQLFRLHLAVMAVRSAGDAPSRHSTDGANPGSTDGESSAARTSRMR